MKTLASALVLALFGNSVGAISHRRLDGEFAAADIEVDATDVINFQQCTGLSVGIDADAAEILLDEDVVGYTKEGDIVKYVSEVTFTVTKDDGTVEPRVTSLPNYLQIISLGAIAQVEAYCEACEDQEEYCNGDGRALEDAEGEDEGAAGDDGVGDDAQYGAVTYVTCDQCAAYGCFEDDDGDNGDDDDGNNWDYEPDEVSVGDVAEWVNGMAWCQQLENGAWNNFNLYASFMCSNDGKGFTVGVFLDEECTIYFSLESYYAIAYGTDDFGPYQEMDDFFASDMAEGFDCDKEYYASQYAENADEDDDEDDGEGTVCQNLYMYSIPLDTCEAEYEIPQDEDEDDDDANDDAEQVDYSNIYEAMISAEDAQDPEAVCAVIQELDGALGYTFDSEFDMNDESTGAGKYAGLGMDTWSIVDIVGFTVLILGFSYCCYRSQTKKKEEPDVEDKTKPLV